MKDRPGTRLETFLFPLSTDHWLATLRIGLGIQVVCYCVALRPDWMAIFAGDGAGLVSRDLAEAILDLKSPLIPRLGWLISLGAALHLEEATVLSLVLSCLLGASICLLLGFLCRPAAVVTWGLYLAVAKSGNLFSYGVDNFTLIGLFYQMIAPLPDRWSRDWKWQRRSVTDPARLGFHLRVLQIHLCLIYFFGGITKAVGPGWWNGASLWLALSDPPFDLVPLSFLLRLRALLPAMGILVCALETGYPVFIWWRKTRTPCLAAVLGMHLMIGLTMGLYLFSLVMIILNLAAFGAALPWPRREGGPRSADRAMANGSAILIDHPADPRHSNVAR